MINKCTGSNSKLAKLPPRAPQEGTAPHINQLPHASNDVPLTTAMRDSITCYVRESPSNCGRSAVGSEWPVTSTLTSMWRGRLCLEAATIECIGARNEAAVIVTERAATG